MPPRSFSREIASQISRENYPIVSAPTLPLFQPRISSRGGYIIGFLFHLFILAAVPRPAVRPSFSTLLWKREQGAKEGEKKKWPFGYIVNFSSSLCPFPPSLSLCGRGRFLLEHLFAVSSVTL